MKLADYLIADRLGAGDWRGAAAALADHFQIVIPDDCRLDLLVDSMFVPEVEIWTGAGRDCYSWREGRGFYRGTAWYNAGIVINIYMPSTS